MLEKDALLIASLRVMERFDPDQKQAADRLEELLTTRTDVTDRTPTRALMRQLFEQQDTTLTLDIGYFGDGVDDNVNVGPNGGFSPDALVLSFESGGNQHAFVPGDAQHVRQLIQAMLGWLDWVDSGCVRTTEEIK